MTETTGHAEQGIRIEETAPRQAGVPGIDRRLDDAVQAAVMSASQLLVVARDIVTTEEGEQYRKTVLAGTRDGLRHSYDAILHQADTVIGQARDRLTRKAGA
jgi:hypothetical protein